MSRVESATVMTARRTRLAAALAAALMLAGCSTRPVTVMPAEAVQAALAHPEVAAWYAAHSAPKVLEGLSPAAARGLQRFRPDALVDLVSEGLLVRFSAALGAGPRRVEVLVDQADGRVLEVRMGRSGWLRWR